MPDRRGPQTSDVDLMITPISRWGDHLFNAWDLAVELEKAWGAKFKRPLHVNVDDVSDGHRSLLVWQHGSY